VNDYAGKLIMAVKVKVGDTKVEALERLSGIRGVLMDNKGVGLLDADLISLESGPYVFNLIFAGLSTPGTTQRRQKPISPGTKVDDASPSSIFDTVIDVCAQCFSNMTVPDSPFKMPRKAWFFAFDEAQYGYELLKEKQRFWHGKRDKTMRRGIAYPFIRTLDTFMMPVVIAGTALSLRSAESCKSDLGKAESSVVFTDFSSLCLAEIEQKIVKLVNLDGVDLKSTSLWKLEGRGRLFGGLILTLAGGCLSSDKIDSLNAATEKHFDSVLQGLKKCIKDAYSPPTDPLERNAFPGSLEVLGIAALWGGAVALDADRFDIDLLHVGLCSIEKSSVVGDSYVLSEELGRQAIRESAQDENLVGRGFSRVVRLCTPAAGHAMEPLLVAELAAWYSRHNSPTVKQFISALFDDDDLPSNLPDWVNHASFNVKQGCSKQNRIDASCDNDIEFIALAVKEDKHRGRLLSPSTVKRPDCEVVMGPKDSKDYSWFLAASSKLYGKPFDDSNFNDLRST
jgi:hypothetical protein